MSLTLDHVVIRVPEPDALAERISQATGLPVLRGWTPGGERISRGVRFANGGYQVSYDTVLAIEESRKGDRVRMCFVSTPLNCPRGDDRGKVYNSTNLRTHKSWRLPDAEHSCGGA